MPSGSWARPPRCMFWVCSTLFIRQWSLNTFFFQNLSLLLGGTCLGILPATEYIVVGYGKDAVWRWDVWGLRNADPRSLLPNKAHGCGSCPGKPFWSGCPCLTLSHGLDATWGWGWWDKSHYFKTGLLEGISGVKKSQKMIGFICEIEFGGVGRRNIRTTEMRLLSRSQKPGNQSSCRSLL